MNKIISIEGVLTITVVGGTNGSTAKIYFIQFFSSFLKLMKIQL